MMADGLSFDTDTCCKQSRPERGDEATSSSCGLPGPESGHLSASATVTQHRPANNTSVDAADDINNGTAVSNDIDDLGDLIKAIQFCDDDEEETEIFFGSVSGQEQRKASKYGHRRTAVFQPTFRQDRSLMRYTMDHRMLGLVSEEDGDEEEESGEDVHLPGGDAMKERSHTNNDKVAHANHPVLNGFKHDLENICEITDVSEDIVNGNSYSENEGSKGLNSPKKSGDANRSDGNSSLNDSNSSDFQVTIRSPNPDAYRIVHLEDISADEDSFNTSKNSGLNNLIAERSFSNGTVSHVEGTKLDFETESDVADMPDNPCKTIAEPRTQQCSTSSEGTNQMQNGYMSMEEVKPIPAHIDKVDKEDKPHTFLSPIKESQTDADDSNTHDLSPDREGRVKPIELECVVENSPSLEITPVDDDLTNDGEIELDVSPAVDNHATCVEVESKTETDPATEVTSSDGYTPTKHLISDGDDEDVETNGVGSVPDNEPGEKTADKLETESSSHGLDHQSFQRDSLDSSKADISLSNNQQSTIDISVDSLEITSVEEIQEDVANLSIHGEHGDHGKRAVGDMGLDSLESPHVAAKDDALVLEHTTKTDWRHIQSVDRVDESGDMFSDDSPYCTRNFDTPSSISESVVTPAVSTSAGSGRGSVGNIMGIPPATAALPRIAMSTPIALHAAACHRSAFSAFITPIKPSADNSGHLGNTLDTVGSGSHIDTGDASNLALTLANVCRIGSMGSGVNTDDSQSCLFRSTDQSEVLFQTTNNGDNTNSILDTTAEVKNQMHVKENITVPATEDDCEIIEIEAEDTSTAGTAFQDAEISHQLGPNNVTTLAKESTSEVKDKENSPIAGSREKLDNTEPLPLKDSDNSCVLDPIAITPHSQSERTHSFNSSTAENNSDCIIFKETRFSPSIFNRSSASPSPSDLRKEWSQLEDSDVVIFKETGFSPTVPSSLAELENVACGSPNDSQCDIVTVSAMDRSLSEITRNNGHNDNNDERDEGVGSGEEELLTPPSAGIPDTDNLSATASSKSLQQATAGSSLTAASAPVAKLFPKASPASQKQPNRYLSRQHGNSAKPATPRGVFGTQNRVRTTPRSNPKNAKPVGRTPTSVIHSAFGRGIPPSMTTVSRTPPGPNPRLFRNTPVSAPRGKAEALNPSSNAKPPIFKCGTPRYLPGQKTKTVTQSPGNLKRTAPPKFDLDDSPAAKSSTGRTVLDEKIHKLEMLQEEKRRVQEKLAKMQSPLASAGRSPARPAMSPVPVRSPLTPTSADNLPRVRYKDTQSPSQALYLSAAELDAVTKIHTLCNAQQVSKIVTKARAAASPVALTKHRVACKEASKLQWQEDLVAEGDGTYTPTESDSTDCQAKSILHIRPSEDIFPFNDQQPSPVVIRKLAKRTNTLCPSKT